MYLQLKLLFQSLGINILGIIAAIAALIGLSYTNISAFMYPLCFVGILGIAGIISTRILLADCNSGRPLKEAFGIMFVALIVGCSLNYLIMSLAFVGVRISDEVVFWTTVITSCLALFWGGILYCQSASSRQSKRFYLGVILWQSLSGIWAIGFIAYFLWGWSWLV